MELLEGRRLQDAGALGPAEGLAQCGPSGYMWVCDAFMGHADGVWVALAETFRSHGPGVCVKTVQNSDHQAETTRLEGSASGLGSPITMPLFSASLSSLLY